MLLRHILGEKLVGAMGNRCLRKGLRRKGHKGSLWRRKRKDGELTLAGSRQAVAESSSRCLPVGAADVLCRTAPQRWPQQELGHRKRQREEKARQVSPLTVSRWLRSRGERTG